MKYTINITPETRDYVNQLDVETLLRLVTCPNYRAGVDEEIYDTLCAFIHPQDKDLMIDKVKKLKSHISHKLLLNSDMEAGPGTAIYKATAFPSMRAVAETKDPHLAYEMGRIAALESEKVGFNWTFAPCSDILGNHFSPMTSIRSAGETAEDVIPFVENYMKGLQDNGLIACSKHFPGDGYSLFDQHLTTAANPLTKEEWDNSFRKVYETLINEGLMSIMPGHISLGCYDEIDKNTGIYPPATLSYNLLTQLLKEDLGFEGLIISDATEMSGFCGYMNYYEACAQFLMAGGDCLLFTHPNAEYLENMKSLIAQNKLTLDVLRNRVCRISQFVSNYKEPGKIEIDYASHEALAKLVVAKSTKIYKDKFNYLPLKKNIKIALVVISQQIKKEIPSELEEALKAYGTVSVFNDVGCGKLKEMAKSHLYDAFIVICGCNQWYGTNMITVSGTLARNMMNGWMKYGTPCVFVDFGNPYLHEEYPAMIDSLIYTYGYNNYTIEKVCHLLFGE